MDTVIRFAATCVLLIVLCSCSGGGERSQPGDATASVSLRIAAEPIEWVEEVVLQIRGVVFIRREDGRETHYKPERVMQLGLMSAGLLGSTIVPEITLPAGEYMMIRIDVDATENVRDSYVRSLRGEECEIRTLSSGLVAYGYIDLREAHTKSLTIVANLRRALHPAECVGGYSLRSDADLVDDQKAGWFTGSVDPILVRADCEPKVYVFLEGAIVDDVADVIPAHDSPVSVATVQMQHGIYRYRTRLLPPLIVLQEQSQLLPMCQSGMTCLRPASYLLAFTCGADDPVLDEDIRFSSFAALILQGGVANEVNLEAPRGGML